jgi:hypothetical protein
VKGKKGDISNRRLPCEVKNHLFEKRKQIWVLLFCNSTSISLALRDIIAFFTRISKSCYAVYLKFAQIFSHALFLFVSTLFFYLYTEFASK